MSAILQRIDYYKNLEFPPLWPFLNKETTQIEKMLFYAINNNDLGVVKYMLENDHYKNVQISYLFNIAVNAQNLETLEYLISQYQNKQFAIDYSLNCACKIGCLDTVKFLVSQGANVKHTENWPALTWAIQYKFFDIVKFLVLCGAIVNGVDRSNMYFSSIKNTGYLEIIKFLVCHGLSLDCIGDPELLKDMKYYKKYKGIMDSCLEQIYGHPNLERTKSEQLAGLQNYKNNILN